MAKVIAFKQRNPRPAPGAENCTRNFSQASAVISIAGRSIRTSAPPQSEIWVSVVIVTANRPHLLSHCLASLLWQRFDTARYEVIVVDEKPDPCTRDIVSDWAAHARPNGLKITYIPVTEPQGIAAARNLGWQAARGEIIAFTNDDTVARPDWLQNGWSAFRQEVQAAWGRVVVPYTTSPLDYERYRGTAATGEFSALNCFCRKQVLEELSGFDERFKLAWRDDNDLYFRMLKSSVRIAYAPSAVITTPIRPLTWGEDLRQQKKQQADALLYKKHPKLYKQKIRNRSHWDSYLIVIALISLCIALAGGHTQLAVASGVTWLFFTCWSAMERLMYMQRGARRASELIATVIFGPPLQVFWRLAGAIKYRVPFF